MFARFQQITLYILTFAFGGWIMYWFVSFGYIPPYQTVFSPKNAENSYTPFTDQRIQEALTTVQREYYGYNESGRNDLVHGVIAGLVSGLKDEHSQFMTSDEAKEFDESLGGDFEGIGAVIESVPGGVQVVSLLKGSPAEQAGLMRKDLILSANGESLNGLTSSEAVTKIRWPKNTNVELKLERSSGSGMTEKFTKTVQRRALTIPTVETEMLSGSVGHLVLSSYGEHSIDEFTAGLNTLLASGATSLILDLRGNGGGYLDASVDIVSHFLEEGLPVVTTKGQAADTSGTEVSAGCDKTCGIPLLILVDGGSASASEITAGAFQDHKRAMLLGEKTYGKWSVQSRFDLSDGSMLKLTIARWYTPKGRGIDHTGITPDIILALTDDDYKARNDRQLKLAQEILSGGLTLQSSALTKVLQSYSGASLSASSQ